MDAEIEKIVPAPRVGNVRSSYCLCSDKDAKQVIKLSFTMSFYDPSLDKSMIYPPVYPPDYCKPYTRHEVLFAEGLNYAGEYWVVVEAQDDHPENNKAHERRWALPLAGCVFIQPSARYGFRGIGFSEDTDTLARKAYFELGQVYNPMKGLFTLCYSGWYPLGEKGGALINKPK